MRELKDVRLAEAWLTGSLMGLTVQESVLITACCSWAACGSLTDPQESSSSEAQTRLINMIVSLNMGRNLAERFQRYNRRIAR